MQVHAPKRRRKRKDASPLQEDPDDFLLPEVAEKRQPTQLAGVSCVAPGVVYGGPVGMLAAASGADLAVQMTVAVQMPLHTSVRAPGGSMWVRSTFFHATQL